VDLGYEHKGEYGIPRRHYFNKREPRAIHVHANEPASTDYQNHILFRDYLRANHERAREYEALKRLLAQRYADDREGYTVNKTSFVLETLKLARAWREISSEQNLVTSQD
jgi:GrpB-like predicted nucleotidyltransferase (UPF0157 family)